MKPERLACLIASRNLGDIIIWSGLFRRLVAANYADRYVVWTRPQMAFMFEDIPNCEVVGSAFPVGTGTRFGVRQGWELLRAARRIRVLKPSVSLDFVGDFRERMFARLAGSRHHLHVGWEPGHPHSRLIRNPFGPGHPQVLVPATVPNVYAGFDLMLDTLIRREPPPTRPQVREHPAHEGYRIGLHPFASQACKLWPQRNWTELARELLSQGIEVVAFAAPAERTTLEAVFAGLEGRVELITADLRQFATAVADLDLMIGLDSFAVHMAYQQGVPAITINAGNPSQLWTTPGGQMLAGTGGCAHFPCYNVAPCRGTRYENACVNSISTAQVLAAVRRAREKAETAAPVAVDRAVR